MRKKVTTWLLCAMLAICGAVGALAFGTSANAEGEPATDPHEIIQKVAGLEVSGDGEKHVSDEEWETIKGYELTGGNTASVKIAVTGTKIYFKLIAEDGTKDVDNDKCFMKMTVGKKTMDTYTNMFPWTPGYSPFTMKQLATSYDETNNNVTFRLGLDLGTDYYIGAEVILDIKYTDSGANTTASYGGKFYIEQEPAPVDEKENEEAKATASPEFVTLWEESDTHKTVTMGGTDSNVSGKLPEVTYKIGETLTAAKNVRMTTTVKLKTDVDDANSWRKVSLGITEGIVFYVQWSDKPDEEAYDAGVSIADSLENDDVIKKAVLPAWLNIDAIKAGVTFKTERAGHKLALYAKNGENFEKLAETTCHAAAETVAAVRGGYCTWEFTDTLVEEFTPETVTPEVPANMLIKGVGGAAGKPTAAEWESLAVHNLSGNSEGYLQFATVGTTLWIRTVVEDTTKKTNGDTLDITVTVGNNSPLKLKMNMQTWTADDGSWIAGEVTFRDLTGYNDSKMQYTSLVGFELGDAYADEATVAVKVIYRDASEKHGTGAALDGGTATTYEATLTIEEPETPPPAVEDPENPDLKIVVTDLPSQPKESDWANATAYNLIALHGGTAGSTGTIKIFTAAQNIFFRVEINDPTTHTNADSKYIYLGNQEVHYEAHGNWENWLTPVVNGEANPFGQPSLMVEKTTAKITGNDKGDWTPGVYTWDYGLYLKDQATSNILWEEEAQIRLCVKFGDSQDSTRPWGTPSGYDHCIYFDQILTFGEKADTTVRPQAPTEGFTGTVSEVSNTNVKINTDGFDGAETYKFFLYGVNPAGSEEPYEHIEIAGPAYSDELPYQLFGLSATTDYLVQIVAYDNSDAPIAYSAFIEFRTLSIQEVTDKKAADAAIKKINAIGEVTLEKESKINEARTAYNALTATQKELVSAETLKVLTDAETALEALKNPVNPNPDDNQGGDKSEESKKKKKCGSVAGGGALAIALIMLGACSVLVLRRKETHNRLKL